MIVVDHNLYFSFINGHYIFLVIYVDDFLFARNDEEWLEFLKSFLICRFEMSKFSFNLSTYIMIQFINFVIRIFLSQQNYALKILERFDMNNYHPS
jgi:hypothetical protein